MSEVDYGNNEFSSNRKNIERYIIEKLVASVIFSWTSGDVNPFDTYLSSR